MIGQSSTFNATPVLADHHFRHWKSVFEHLTGIQLSLERESFVRTVLQKRLVEKGVSCFENYLHQLLASPAFSRGEWEVLFDRIVIGETRFFRHAPTFDFLAEYARDCARGAEDPLLKAWSLGCSTGEEAWSLAMLLYKACKGANQVRDFTVVGTDINRKSLATATQGSYRNIGLRGIDGTTAGLFFESEQNGYSRIRTHLRSRVSFHYHNLLEPVTNALLAGVDIISCQNVLIYLQQWRRRAVIRQLVPTLKVGGVLIVGAGDLVGWKPDGLERLPIADVQAYRRVN